MSRSLSILEIVNDLFEDNLNKSFNVVIDPSHSRISVINLIDLINSYGFSKVTGNIINGDMQLNLTWDDANKSDSQLVKSKLLKELDDNGIRIINIV